MNELNVDDGLAQAIARQENTALEEAFTLHSGAVKGIAMRVLRDEALAEDVVQETFLTLWRDPSRFDSRRGSLRTFLVTIAHRKAVDTVRSEMARSRREEKPPDTARVDVDEEVWTRSVSETVRRALADLPQPQRDAISLAYLGGFSYVEVARRLGEPEGTVKSRIRAGMKRLSAILGEVDR